MTTIRGRFLCGAIAVVGLLCSSGVVHARGTFQVLPPVDRARERATIAKLRADWSYRVKPSADLPRSSEATLKLSNGTQVVAQFLSNGDASSRMFHVVGKKTDKGFSLLNAKERRETKRVIRQTDKESMIQFARTGLYVNRRAFAALKLNPSERAEAENSASIDRAIRFATGSLTPAN